MIRINEILEILPVLQMQVPSYPLGMEGSGCFTIKIKKNPKCKTGWDVVASFQVGLHKKDVVLINKFKSFRPLRGTGVGSINKLSENSIQYRVSSLKDLTNVVIPHFDEYSLISQKRADFELFKSAVDLMNRGEHLTIEGLIKIVSIRASMNNGLTAVLAEAFPNITPADRLKVETREIVDPNWLAGFTLPLHPQGVTG